MQARTLAAVGLLTFTAFAFLPSLATAHAGDCSRSGTPFFTWTNPIGVDYYNTVEGLLGNDPQGDLKVLVQENCTIQGFSTAANEDGCFPLAGPCCPGNSNPCIKFYASFFSPNRHDDFKNLVCSVQLTGSQGVTNMIVTRAFGDADDFQCEGYCKQGVGDCVFGRSVTSRVTLGHRYDWEAPDLLSLPGATSVSGGYFARSRDVSNVAAVNSPQQTHTTCQYGDPLVLQPVTALVSATC